MLAEVWSRTAKKEKPIIFVLSLTMRVFVRLAWYGQLVLRKRKANSVHDRLSGHLLSVYRFAMHLSGDQHSAEDLTQEAMLRALRNLHNLDDPSALRGWLFRIVKNLWIDRYRCRSASNASTHSVEELEGSEPGPCQNAEMGEEIAKTIKAMNRLPQRQRTVLHLIACQQLSVTEVASVLEISSEAVRSSLSLARAQMRRGVLSQDQASYKNSLQD
jgi:RNA polymerase sigma-70 factor, ECF subfamily